MMHMKRIYCILISLIMLFALALSTLSAGVGNVGFFSRVFRGEEASETETETQSMLEEVIDDGSAEAEDALSDSVVDDVTDESDTLDTTDTTDESDTLDTTDTTDESDTLDTTDTTDESDTLDTTDTTDAVESESEEKTIFGEKEVVLPVTIEFTPNSNEDRVAILVINKDKDDVWSVDEESARYFEDKREVPQSIEIDADLGDKHGSLTLELNEDEEWEVTSAKYYGSKVQVVPIIIITFLITLALVVLVNLLIIKIIRR